MAPRDDDDGERRRYRDDGDDHDRRRRDRSRSRSRDRSDKRRKRETSRERADRKTDEKTKKKAEKRKAREEEERRQAAELSIYSATDNPFHDVDLGSKFQWTKKREKEKKQGISTDEAARRDAERRAEAREELDRLNHRRAEREKDMELREAEASRMQQMAESAQMAEWVAKEDEFQLEQARKRAEIRVRANRAKPIDLLALNLKWGNPDGPDVKTNPFEDAFDDEDDGAGLEVDLDEPYAIFDDLSLEETQELHEEIKMHLTLETADRNREFWRCLDVVCQDALRTLSTLRVHGPDALRSHHATKADVARLLNGKSFEKLVELETSIQRKLASGEPVDPEYWEEMVKEIKVWKAKARLRTMHEVVLRNRLESLRTKQRDEAVRQQNELASALAPAPLPTIEEDAAPAEAEASQPAAPPPAAIEEAPEEPEPYARELSPVAWDRVPIEEHGLEVVLAADEFRKLLSARRKVLSSRFVAKPRPTAQPGGPGGEGGDGPGEDRDALAERLYKQEAEKGLDEDEEMLDIEAEIGKQSYSWEDKYRPRKPRYFNKVHTGFEWNKFNQVHYSSDEPPPKVIQGYKFSIFYPDLIDKSRTPSYRIVKNRENPDLATLVFNAGPPYEDIAFSIPNKPWEHSHKRGFKSTFDRGVLSLHFTFARIHYRK